MGFFLNTGNKTPEFSQTFEQTDAEKNLGYIIQFFPQTF